MDLSIIIVNYNVRDYLAECLLSLLPACQGLQAETIVIDNASADGSVEMIRTRFPQVTLIANPENRGFAQAVNQGIRASSGELLVILNPDTLVQADTFTVMRDWLHNHPRCGMAGCTILNADGSFQLACRRKIPTPLSALAKLTGLSRLFPNSPRWGEYNMTWLPADQAAEVEAISGAFMMVRRSVADSVGLLDEQFFMYGEDLDWCLRIRQAGWTIDYVPATRIIHYKGASAASNRLTARREFYRAMYTFVRKHYAGADTIIPRWCLKAGITGLSWLSILRATSTRHAAMMLDGVLLVTAVLAAITLRFGSLIDLPWFGDVRDYLLFCGLAASVWLTALYTHGVYGANRFSLKRISAATGWGFLAVSAIPFFVPSMAFSRLVWLYAGLGATGLLIGWRLAARTLARHGFAGWLGPWRSYIPIRRCLLVGSTTDTGTLCTRLVGVEHGERMVIGYVTTEPDTPDQSAGYRLGDLRDIRAIVASHRIQEILFVDPPVSNHGVIQTMQNCRGLGLEFRIIHQDEPAPTSLSDLVLTAITPADAAMRRQNQSE